MQGCENIVDVARNHVALTPYVLLSENHNEFQAFLIVDKTIVCEMQVFNEIPFILMSSFFVFNICYPKGCTNLYSFMEVKLPSN